MGKDEEPLADADAYLASHLENMLCSTLRNGAFGVDMFGTRVCLCYADHESLVLSEEFDIIERPDLFVLAIATIANAHSTALGFLPFVHFPQDQERATFNGLKIKFPYAKDAAYDETGPWRFEVDTSHGRKFFKAQNPLGRRTTCTPIKVLAKRGEAHLRRISGPLALKTGYWKESDAMNEKTEEDHIRHIRDTLERDRPEGLEHIVEIVCTISGYVKDLELPRASIGRLEGTVPRMFRAIVMPSYMPLANIESVQEFQQVWLDANKGVH